VHPAPTAAETGVLAAPYRALTIGTVVLVSLTAFEAMAVATAMPTVAHALDGLPLYGLAFGGPLAAGVVGMVWAGSWSDARGPRGPVLAGVTAFATGLLICGAAPTMKVLVAGRLLQGVGAGLVSVALYVVVGRVYPPALHPRIFAAFSAAWVVPSMVGPSIAGLVVQHVGWRWVFLAVPVLAVLATVVVLPALRELGVAPAGRRTPATGSWPLVWALGAAVSAGLLHYGGQQRGWLAAAVLALGVAGVVACAPRLLPAGAVRASSGLPAVVALRGVAAAAFFGAEVFVPLLLSRERGLSPTLAGLALTAGALAWSAGSWWQGRPSRPPVRPKRLLQMGMILIAAGILSAGLALVPAVPVFLAVAGWSAAGLGMGLVYPTLAVLTLHLSPRREQGANSSALQLSDSLFSATALALQGAVFAALFTRSSSTAFIAIFAVSAWVALLGVAVAARTE